MNLDYTNKLLERIKDHGAGAALRNLAEAYLAERKRREQLQIELVEKNARLVESNAGLILQLEDALKDRSRYKELLFVQMYTPPMAKVAQFIGGSESMMMARADVAVTIMIASPHDKSKYKFWVDVIKNRFGPNSRHAFDTLLNATEFVRRTWGPK